MKIFYLLVLKINKYLIINYCLNEYHKNILFLNINKMLIQFYLKYMI